MWTAATSLSVISVTVVAVDLLRVTSTFAHPKGISGLQSKTPSPRLGGSSRRPICCRYVTKLVELDYMPCGMVQRQTVTPKLYVTKLERFIASLQAHSLLKVFHWNGVRRTPYEYN